MSGQPFSADRPLYASGPQTQLYKNMQDYAYKPEVQDLMQKMISDVFTERPEAPLEYMIQWLVTEKKRRELAGGN